MKRSKKVGIALTVIVAIVLATFVGSKLYFTDARSYYTSWGITLPKHTEKEYKTEDFGWFGDGIGYDVLQANEDVSAWFEDCAKEKDLKFEQSVTECLSNLQISNEQLPNWEQAYWWKIVEQNNGFDRLFVIYIPSDQKIILATSHI